MAHTQRDREKLQRRLARLRGQIDGVGRALAEERPCGEVLQQVAAIRGAVAGLMAELLEDHVHEHVAGDGIPAAAREQAADELVEVLRRYLR
ncbi:MAG: metal/formaldehyde-sensitive transcriptional repressor [Planctomycetota bacterium]